MRIQLRFLRIATFPIASILLTLLVVVVSRPALAAELKAESDGERYVLAQLKEYEFADLAVLPKDKRQIRASFLAELLTSPDVDKKIHPRGIWINDAIVTGDFDLISRDIPNDVSLVNCTFQQDVDLTDAHFAKGLRLSVSKFNHSTYFSGAVIGSDLMVDNCIFMSLTARFNDVQVGGNFGASHSTFAAETTDFEGMRVGGDLVVDMTSFRHEADFDSLTVKGIASFRGVDFAGPVSFSGAKFSDLFLIGSSFDYPKPANFTRMKFDNGYFKGFSTKTPPLMEQMTFQYVSPITWVKPEALSPGNYDPELYVRLEALYRKQGYAAEADDIFLAGKRTERRQNCTSLLGQCHRTVWAWSLFQDALAGYGKRLENLLYWSLGFLIIGMFVFRSEKGMRIKDEKDAPHYAGRYNAFWYSLDLFLPIIKLGEADVWTPKDNRRWANLYRKVHIIIGSLFVPIGLAAWTGIIK